ncbi:MAG TPA: hypothetical protein VMW58_09915, partial [Anaerolineae bacterium]|nr:hypothetical protein [Anaerolineae bacterium]
MRKLLVGLLVVVLLISACAGGAPTSPPEGTEVSEPTAPPSPEPSATVTPTQRPAAKFEEADCPFDVPEGAPVVCGFVMVPEDHSDPDGTTIKLAVAVVKDESEEHQP